ncbi:CRISPR-associated endonuclease Cas2 [Natroniella acetigena]|uniref:CRISPR-associated endonuclease Cas2 n=1 Tax=Natroniella TaxID=52003 RepID=UPI002009F7C0|nr:MULTISPECIES: CRISPR-associated endonuclease Cas2 [Natroniella]MCK8816760.1 CRISPR-associated endonuclease Cas2 [Natroniella sulfidigena]MCK8826425.1 CRISPR-associated endonuclease Cas2 [Natroniella acetigena]
MYSLLIYDISDDKIRRKVSESCKDYGLKRVQWSAFLGKLNHNRREELMLKISRVLGDAEGNIRLYPICSKDLKLMQEIDR